MQEQMATVPEHQEIARMAKLVAREMHQRKLPKNHGEYQVYDDGRLRISLDSYVPNLVVWVIREETPVRVYLQGCHDQRPSEYHPGRWTSHLRELSLEAERIQDAKESDRETRRRLDEAARMAPIDDRDIFPEQPGPGE